MSGKDVLKLLLIAYGFTKIEIKTYRGEYNYVGYEIHATNEDGECYDEENCDDWKYTFDNGKKLCEQILVIEHAYEKPQTDGTEL